MGESSKGGRRIRLATAWGVEKNIFYLLMYRNNSFDDTCIDLKYCQEDFYLVVYERPSASDSFSS